MLAGCMNKSIERGKEITPEEQSVIVDGQTTKSEIFMNFGELSKTMNNKKVFFYPWTRGGKRHFLGLGSGLAESKSLVIVFNDDDIVESHRITRGATRTGADIND
jgi:hypothetical protein